MQATHDILFHSFNISKYDHLQFPGVVPRTFVGPLVVSATVSPLVTLVEWMEMHKFWAQYLVRFSMAAFVAVAWHQLRRTIIQKLGLPVGAWFTVITITQFHFVFYMSRLLPNIMALPLTLFAVKFWIDRRERFFIVSSGATIIIFRSELAILFGLLLLYDIYFKRTTIPEVLKTAIPAAIILVAFTILVDSFFWQRFLWPEAEVFWYNTILNKSKDWGTSPFLWYFYSALPRALGASLIFIPIGLYYEPRIRALVVPAILYVFLYSMLPHKELRFIIYVFPLFNLAAACACSRLWTNRGKGVWRALAAAGAAGHLLGNCVITMFLLLVSSTNYPGGVAMSRLHRLVPEEWNVTVHIDNLAAQTGVTRFTQLNDNWIYDKDEDLKPGDEEYHWFNYILTEAKDKLSPEMQYLTQTHDTMEFIECFSNIGIQYGSMIPIKIKTKSCIYLMERKKHARSVQPLSPTLDDDASIDELIESLSETLNNEEDDFPGSAEERQTSNEKITQSDEETIDDPPIKPEKIRKIRTRIISRERESPKDQEVKKENKLKLRQMLRTHFTKVNDRGQRQEVGSADGSPKAKLRKLIRSEQVKALVEDFAKLDLKDMCEPNLTPKACLKQLIDEYFTE